MKKREKNKLKNQRRFWVRPIFYEERRRLQGASNNLIREMQHIDMEKYVEYLRMDILTFRKLLRLIEPKIEKQHAVRSPICFYTSGNMPTVSGIKNQETLFNRHLHQIFGTMPISCPTIPPFRFRFPMFMGRHP